MTTLPHTWAASAMPIPGPDDPDHPPAWTDVARWRIRDAIDREAREGLAGARLAEFTSDACTVMRLLVSVEIDDIDPPDVGSAPDGAAWAKFETASDGVLIVCKAGVVVVQAWRFNRPHPRAFLARDETGCAIGRPGSGQPIERIRVAMAWLHGRGRMTDGECCGK